jgi:hypothetical protein
MKKLYINTTNLISLYEKGGSTAVKSYINKYDAYVTNGQGAQLILDAILENKSDIYIKECLQNIKKTI